MEEEKEMTNKNRLKGDRFEYRVLDVMIADGWFAARRPRSAFPDIIAIKDAGGGMFRSIVRLIECKVKRKYLRKAEREELIRLAASIGATPWLAYRDKRKVIMEMLG